MKYSKTMFLTLLIVLMSTAAFAAVPHLINYQGRLTDASGNPSTGSYNVTFRIYDAESAGNLLWQETQTAVVVDKGLFGVLLGSVTALNIPFDQPYFLEIKVGEEVMSPRQRITSSGYAIRAEVAESVSGFDPGLVGTKTVDESSIGNKKILFYDSPSGKVQYKEPAGWQFVEKRTGDNTVLNENFVLSPNVRYRFSWRMWQNTGAGGSGIPYLLFNNDTGSTAYRYALDDNTAMATSSSIQIAGFIKPLGSGGMGSFELETILTNTKKAWVRGDYVIDDDSPAKKGSLTYGWYAGSNDVSSMQFKHSGSGYLYYEIICEKFVNG